MKSGKTNLKTGDVGLRGSLLGLSAPTNALGFVRGRTRVRPKAHWRKHPNKIKRCSTKKEKASAHAEAPFNLVI